MSFPATSKPSLRVTVAEELLDELRSHTKADRKVIGEAMNAVVAAWGKPHLHSGAGIRRLSGAVFECRAGLARRLMFLVIVTPPELVFFFIGNHDEVQHKLRSLR